MDYYGFKIEPIATHHKKALILGTGGASRVFALDELDIAYTCFKPKKTPLIMIEMRPLLTITKL
jgi:hypothetical protein